MAPAGAGDVAEQHVGHRPGGRGRPGPEGEGPVAQAEHAGQAGEHDPGPGGGPADEQGPAAAPQQDGLDPVQPGRADPAAEPGGEQAGPPAPADPVPGRVAGQGAGGADGQGGGQRDAVLLGQHATEQQGHLARQDQSEEGRRLKGREEEQERQGRPAGERQQAFRDLFHGPSRRRVGVPVAGSPNGGAVASGSTLDLSLGSAAAPQGQPRGRPGLRWRWPAARRRRSGRPRRRR